MEELLRTLRAEYLASIPEKIVVIEKQILASDAPNLRESFHKLKGTGTTYGLPEVSSLAATVEDICIRLPAHQAVASCQTALAILRDIHSAKSTQKPFDLERDARMLELRKLLPN